MNARRIFTLAPRTVVLAGVGMSFYLGLAACAGGGDTSEDTSPGVGPGGTGGASAGKGGTAGASAGSGGSKAGSGGSTGGSGGGGAGGSKAGSGGSTGGSGGGGAGGSKAGSGGGGSGGSTGGSGGSTGGAAGSTGGSGGSKAGSGGSTGGSGGSVGGASGAGAGGSNPGCGPEKCNNVDDSCPGTPGFGQIDEGDPESGGACDTGKKGECAAGTLHCVMGNLKCVQNKTATKEICNGLDDNCDGAVDNGPFDDTIKPTPGDACQAKDQNGVPLKGICLAGTQTCDAGVVKCKQDNSPGTEVCNGLDDNCDGQVDEGNPGAGQACKVGGFNPATPCSNGQTGCGQNGQMTCAQTVFPESEKCDGVDNDCNGSIDDGLNGQPCIVPNGKGECAKGTLTCIGGNGLCQSATTPKPETCDGLDNDCSGLPDDGPPNSMCTNNYPSATNVATWSCGGAVCTILNCSTGYANIDGAPANGCECQSDAWATTCSGANGNSVSVGASTSQSGVVETDNGEDWIRFNFSPPAAGTAYTQKIQLTDAAGGQYRIDVYSSCGNLAACGSETGANASVWEQKYTYIPGSPPNDTWAKASQVYVKVTRTGGAATCSKYTVTASQG